VPWTIVPFLSSTVTVSVLSFMRKLLEIYRTKGKRMTRR
jgi:hypothetical protein